MTDDRTMIRRPTDLRVDGQGRTGCLVVLSGRAIGKLYTVGSGVPTVLGRSDAVAVRVEDDGTSRRHAMIEPGTPGEFVLVDLGSTNGTFVNGQKIQRHVLQEGDRIQLGTSTVLKFSYQGSLEAELQRHLYETATRDALTGSYNRRYFEEQLGQHFSHAQRHAVPLSLTIFDIDHFKLINDTHGHPAGDEVLRQVGLEVAGAVRREDVFCRIGGEEFAVVLRDTPHMEAVNLAERLRKLVAELEPEHDGHSLKVTISLGVATFDETRHRRPEALIEEADQHLYEAKRTGRNRVGVRSSTEATCRVAARS